MSILLQVIGIIIFFAFIICFIFICCKNYSYNIYEENENKALLQNTCESRV